MSDKFLGTSSANLDLTDGSANLFVNSITLNGLNASQTVSTDPTKTLTTLEGTTFDQDLDTTDSVEFVDLTLSGANIKNKAGATLALQTNSLIRLQISNAGAISIPNATSLTLNGSGNVSIAPSGVGTTTTIGGSDASAGETKLQSGTCELSVTTTLGGLLSNDNTALIILESSGNASFVSTAGNCTIGTTGGGQALFQSGSGKAIINTDGAVSTQSLTTITLTGSGDVELSSSAGNCTIGPSAGLGDLLLQTAVGTVMTVEDTGRVVMAFTELETTGSTGNITLSSTGVAILNGDVATNINANGTEIITILASGALTTPNLTSAIISSTGVMEFTSSAGNCTIGTTAGTGDLFLRTVIGTVATITDLGDFNVTASNGIDINTSSGSAVFGTTAGASSTTIQSQGASVFLETAGVNRVQIRNDGDVEFLNVVDAVLTVTGVATFVTDGSFGNGNCVVGLTGGTGDLFLRTDIGAVLTITDLGAVTASNMTTLTLNGSGNVVVAPTGIATTTTIGGSNATAGNTRIQSGLTYFQTGAGSGVSIFTNNLQRFAITDAGAINTTGATGLTFDCSGVLNIGATTATSTNVGRLGADTTVTGLETILNGATFASLQSAGNWIRNTAGAITSSGLTSIAISNAGNFSMNPTATGNTTNIGGSSVTAGITTIKSGGAGFQALAGGAVDLITNSVSRMTITNAGAITMTAPSGQNCLIQTSGAGNIQMKVGTDIPFTASSSLLSILGPIGGGNLTMSSFGVGELRLSSQNADAILKTTGTGSVKLQTGGVTTRMTITNTGALSTTNITTVSLLCTGTLNVGSSGNTSTFGTTGGFSNTIIDCSGGSSIIQTNGQPRITVSNAGATTIASGSAVKIGIANITCAYNAAKQDMANDTSNITSNQYLSEKIVNYTAPRTKTLNNGDEIGQMKRVQTRLGGGSALTIAGTTSFADSVLSVVLTADGVFVDLFWTGSNWRVMGGIGYTTT